MKSTFKPVLVSIAWFAVVCGSGPAGAQILVDEGAQAPVRAPEKTKVGEDAATDYFRKRAPVKGAASAAKVQNSERVLGVHIGTFLNDTAYRWGRTNKLEDAGKGMIGVTYRVGEWTSSMDLNIRAELMRYDVDKDDPLKLSVMPIVAFPDARSAFPLYFGAGLGVGIFFEQAGDESDISADYALIVGARFPTVFESGGLFFETGLKGQIHLLSSGQHDGVFLSAGALFAF
jgi:hypothetical protein